MKIGQKAFESFFSKAFTSVANELDSWVESFDPMNFSSRYKRTYIERYSRVKILGMSKPVDINDIYTEVVACRNIPSRIYFDIEELEKYISDLHRSDYQIGEPERQSATDFLMTTDKALILGKPGSGKTTLLRYLAVKLLSNQPPFSSLPIYLALKEYCDSDFNSLLDYITHDFDKYCGFPERNAKPFLERIFKKGYAIFMLDGLDEVDIELRRRTIQEIEKFSSRYPESKYVISCRTADYDNWFTDYDEVELADFTSRQINEFIHKWFGRDERRAALLIDALEVTPHIRELCSVPLLTALMCILFQYNLKLPENRSELYGECIDALLYKWDSSRLVSRPTDYSVLSSQKKKALFSNIAFDLMEQEKVVFSKAELLKCLSKHLENYSIDDADGVLREIATHHALFLQRSALYWSFMHLTFQEYFAALYYVQNRKENILVNRHFDNPRWREVFLMASALLPDVRNLGRAMARKLVEDDIIVKYREYLPLIITFGSHGAGLKECKDFVEELAMTAENIYGRAFLPEPKSTKTQKSESTKIPQIKALRMANVLRDSKIKELYNFPQKLYGRKIADVWGESLIRNLVGRKKDPFFVFFREIKDTYPRLSLFFSCISSEASLSERDRKEIINSVFPDLIS